MAKSDELHELIQKMDRGEKRQFRLFAQLQGKGRENLNYLELFDLIEAQAVYNKEAVVEKLRNPVFAKNLPNGKNHLYGLITDFLRQYHSGKDIQFRIREMWIDIHVLLDKGLNRQADKKLDKALQLAKDHGLFGAYIEFSRLKRKFVRNFYHDKKSTLLKDISKEMRSQYSKLGDYLDVIDMFEKIFFGVRDQTFNDEEWESTIHTYRKKLETFDTKGQSLEDVLFYFTPLISYYNRKKEFQASLEIYEDALSVLENDPVILKENAGRFMVFLNNYFNVCILSKDFDQMEEIIERMERVKPMTPEEKKTLPAIVLYCRLIMLIVTEKHEEVIPLAPELERVFLSSAPMTVSRRWAVCTNTGTAFMVAGDYKGAIFWLNVPALDPDPNTLQLVQYLARMCLLICHEAIGNFKLMEHYEDSLTRFIYKQPRELKATMKKPFRVLQQYLYAGENKGQRKSSLKELIELTADIPAMSELTFWATKTLSALST